MKKNMAHKKPALLGKVDPKSCYEVFLNYNCNAKCAFCSQGDFDKSLNAPLRDILRRILTGYKLGYRKLGFTGGEPLIHRDIFKVLSFARAVGFPFIRVQTNGIKLADEKFASAAAAAGLTYCKFSTVSHLPAVHDRLVGVPGAHAALLKALANLRVRKIRIGMNIIVTRETFASLSETVKAYMRAGVGDFVIIYPVIMGALEKNIKRLGVPLPVAVPEIGKAMALCRREGINALCLNVPPCFLKNDVDSIILGNFNTVVTDPTGRSWDLDENRGESKIYGEACVSCVMKGECAGAEATYIGNFGWKGFEPFRKRVNTRPDGREEKGGRAYFTDNERCFVEILNRENGISTVRVLELARDIVLCRGCDDGNAVMSAGESLIKAGLIKRAVKKGVYYWTLLKPGLSL